MVERPCAADMPEQVLDSTARRVVQMVPLILSYFEDPEVQARFEAWKANREKETKQ